MQASSRGEQLSPLRDAVAAAAQAAGDFEAADIPPWQRPFQFARRLQSIPSVTPSFDPVGLKLAVFEFYAADTRIGGCLEAEFGDAHAVFDIFVAVWALVQYPEGEGPLEAAVRHARLRPLTLARSPGDMFRALVSTGYYLQKLVGDRPIMLPVPKLAELFSTHKVRISRLILFAVQSGYLAPVDQTYSYKQGRARTFRFNFDALG